MGVLKTLKYPLLMSALIFGVSTLTVRAADFYAALLAVSYLILGSAAAIGKNYFELTGKRSAKLIVAMILDPPGVFVLVLGLFYMVTADLHWIFIGTAAFLAIIILVVEWSDWQQEIEKSRAQESE